MILIPLIAAIGNVLGLISDKVVLSIRRVPLGIYQTILFIFLCFFTALLMPFLGRINFSLALSATYLAIFGVMIATAIIWNIFYYRGIQNEEIYEFELIITLTPLMTTFLAGLFLPEERNWRVIEASVVASLALLLCHLRKRHFVFSNYSLGLIICVLLMSLEMIFQKLLLKVYSPVSLYFFRTLVIVIFFVIFYRPKIAKINLKSYGLIICSAAAGVVQMVLKFYSFEIFGVVYTTLFMILAPILIYLSSVLIFKEKLSKRTILAAAVILACMVWASWK